MTLMWRKLSLLAFFRFTSALDGPTKCAGGGGGEGGSCEAANNNGLESYDATLQLNSCSAPDGSCEEPRRLATNSLLQRSQTIVDLASNASNQANSKDSYYMMPLGECCCPASDRISNKADCMAAIKALGRTNMNMAWEGNSHSYPGGCSWKQVTNEGLFNKRKTTNGRSSRLSQVCKARGEAPKAHALMLRTVENRGWLDQAAPGVWFGFGNENADEVFCTTQWDKQLFMATVGGVAGTIQVWKDNLVCKSSCGRWAGPQRSGPWGLHRHYGSLYSGTSIQIQEPVPGCYTPPTPSPEEASCMPETYGCNPANWIKQCCGGLTCKEGVWGRNGTAEAYDHSAIGSCQPTDEARRAQAVVTPSVGMSAYYIGYGCHDGRFSRETNQYSDKVGYFSANTNGIVWAAHGAAASCCRGSIEGNNLECYSPSETCHGGLSHAQATETCRVGEWQLCSKEELLSDKCCGTGSQECDVMPKWTRTGQAFADAFDGSQP